MIAMIPQKLVSVVFYPDGRMDTHNAAIYMGLTEKTLAMQRCEGTGPKFVKRGRVFYFQSDVDVWINAAGRHNSTAQAKHRARADTVSSSCDEAQSRCATALPVEIAGIPSRVTKCETDTSKEIQQNWSGV
jgi:hypothetical protein